MLVSMPCEYLVVGRRSSQNLGLMLQVCVAYMAWAVLKRVRRRQKVLGAGGGKRPYIVCAGRSRPGSTRQVANCIRVSTGQQGKSDLGIKA
jgi:hypothetical protein